jgi:hypothetical protein
MRSARTVVAINISPEAPIHEAADYSVVGDLYEVVPALVQAIRDARAGKNPGSRDAGERDGVWPEPAIR